MEDQDKYIEETCELFRAELEKSVSMSKNPENLKWAIFSTGSRELEEAVMDRLVSNLLKHVEGVYVFRPANVQACIRELEKAIDMLKERETEETMASIKQNDEYKVTLGN